MDRFFGLLALTGFVLSLIAHTAALLSIDVQSYVPFIWLLHVGIFVVFGPYVLSSRKSLGTKPNLAVLRATFPAWVVNVGMVLMAYCVLNFLLFMIKTEGGNATIQNGKYVLLEHGRLIRELTQPEYRAFMVNEIRGFSGHWLIFYFVPLAYFLFRDKGPTPASATP